MWLLTFILLFGRLIWAQGTAINVADVPQCARDCLSNSTSIVAAACASLNVACLCNSPEFVSAFYCCLSTQCDTSEQATAITFNQQQCAAVNATAPDFVGCSPLKATSTAGGIKTAITVTPSNAGPYSTIASLVSEPGTFATSQVTAMYSGQPLLTDNCAMPLFAIVSASQDAFLFPQVGCAPSRQTCCPFDSNIEAVITRCPQDYFTTAGGCCPTGFQPFSVAIGAETPCYSVASTILIPASTPSISGLTIVTDHVFSRKYTLSGPQRSVLPAGGIAGIVIVAVALVTITAIVIWWIKRKKKSQILEAERSGTTFPPEEPVLPPTQSTASPHELASPDITGYKSPSRGYWPAIGMSSPPAYEKDKPLPLANQSAPQELPGSTYIDEHHPRFTASEAGSELSATEVSRTPARSPVTSATGSPAMTPMRDDHETRALSPSIVSPLGSPKIPRTTTDQSIVSEKD